MSTVAKRGIWIGVVAMLAAWVVLGTRYVPTDDPLAQGTVAFDPATFGAENFAAVQSGVTDRAVDAATLSAAIAADPTAAATDHAVESSGGPVFSTKFTGVVGEGRSGIYPVTVTGVEPSDLVIRVQTGPAINGTELRDATGEFLFGQFKNQIEFQNAAAALNDELKARVLANIDTANLSGKTVTIAGAFTLVNPKAWLVTPVSIDVS
jgi:predicted lipoprotein